MDLANQEGAFGFLRGGFAVASWLLQFNTLHSSLAIASPVCLSQCSHYCSSLLSSDEDDTMLAVYQISSCVMVLSTFECKELCYFQKNTSEFCCCLFLLYCHVHHSKFIHYIAR
jgi:hypothetical protein